jgi:ribosome-binding ATPase YchF (GTP1/OBG family)
MKNLYLQYAREIIGTYTTKTGEKISEKDTQIFADALKEAFKRINTVDCEKPTKPV